MGGDLKHIIKTFSFASDRFERFRRPPFHVLCLLVPIVMMLTMIAEDWRDDKAKGRAEKVLNALIPGLIVNMGADYAQSGLRLIRAFDVLARDPATSRVLLE